MKSFNCQLPLIIPLPCEELVVFVLHNVPVQLLNSDPEVSLQCFFFHNLFVEVFTSIFNCFLLLQRFPPLFPPRRHLLRLYLVLTAGEGCADRDLLLLGKLLCLCYSLRRGWPTACHRRTAWRTLWCTRRWTRWRLGGRL